MSFGAWQCSPCCIVAPPCLDTHRRTHMIASCGLLPHRVHRVSCARCCAGPTMARRHATEVAVAQRPKRCATNHARGAPPAHVCATSGGPPTDGRGRADFGEFVEGANAAQRSGALHGGPREAATPKGPLRVAHRSQPKCRAHRTCGARPALLRNITPRWP